MAAVISNGVAYGKPNMAALEGELGRRIIHTILTTPKPDSAEFEQRCADISARIQRARDNGTF